MLFKAVAVVFCLLAPFVVATADNPGQFRSFSSHLLLNTDITHYWLTLATARTTMAKATHVPGKVVMKEVSGPYCAG